MTTLVANMLMCLLGALAIGFIFGYLIARAFAKQKHAIEIEDLNKIIDKKDMDNKNLLEKKDILNNELIQFKKDTEINLQKKDNDILKLKSDLKNSSLEVSQKLKEIKDRDSGISLLQMGLVSAKNKMQKQSKVLKDKDSGVSLLNVGLVAAKDKIGALEKRSEKLKLDIEESLGRENVLSREKDSLNSKISTLNKELKVKNEEVLDLKNKVKELDDTIVHNNVLAKTYQTLNLDPNDDTIKQIEDNLLATTSKVKDLEKSVLEKDSLIKTFEEKVSVADKKIKELERDVSLKNITIKTFQDKDKKAKEKIGNLEKVLKDKDDSIKEFKHEVATTIEKVHSLEESVAQKDLKLEEIKNSKEAKVGHFLVGGGLFSEAKKIFETMSGRSGKVDQKVDEVIEDYKKKSEIDKIELIQNQIKSIKNRKPGVVTDVKTLGIKGASKKAFRSATVREAEINEQIDKVINEYKINNSIVVEESFEKNEIPKIKSNSDLSNISKVGLVAGAVAISKKVADEIKEKGEEIETPEVETPKVELETPKVEVPKVEIETPEVDVPKVEIETPEVEIPKVEIETPKVNIPKVEIETPEVEVPKVEIETPEIDIPKVELETPEVDVPKVEIETPEIDIPKVEIETPEVDIPKVELETPEVEIPKVELETPKVEIPKVELETPEVEVSKVEIETPEVNIPKVELETPEIETNSDLSNVSKVGLVAGAVAISKKVADEIKGKVEEVETLKENIKISKVKSNNKILATSKASLAAGSVAISKKVVDEIKDKVEEGKVSKVKMDAPEIDVPKVNVVDHVVIEESLVNRESVNVKLYKEDLNKYEDYVDEKLLSNVIDAIDPSIYGKNWKIISCSKKVDLAIIREEFLKKVLNLSDSNRQFDRSIKEICKKLKNAKRKNRVTVYYLLAKKYNMYSF